MAGISERNSKRTYSLDTTTLGRFESLVPAGQRSQVIEELLARRVAEMENARLRELIHEGLEYMSDVYTETAKDWSHVDAEGWPAQ